MFSFRRQPEEPEQQEEEYAKEHSIVGNRLLCVKNEAAMVPMRCICRVMKLSVR